jgi:hypothetical protein
MRDPYPSTVPIKYDPDGNAQAYVGNSVICPLSPSSLLYGSLLSLREKLRNSSFAHLFARDALMEPANWHTTVFIGARDKIRSKGYWPKDLPSDVPQDEVLTDKLRKFDLQCTPPYRMKVSSVGRTKYSINVQLTPETAEEEGRLKDLRNRLSDYLGIRHPQHDSFTFHLTLAYLLRWLDDGQKQELDALLQEHFETMPAQMELGRPTFCTFQNMKGWSPVLELKNL